MADAGLKVLNSGSRTVIDSTYKNMVFKQRKTKTMDARPYKSNHVTFYNCDAPIVVMGDTGGKYCMMSWTEVDNDDDYSYSILAESNGGTGEYFMFDTPDEVTDDAYGMKVWDSKGKPVFNSTYSYLRIVDMFTVSTRGEDINKTYGHKVGVVLNRRWSSWIMLPPPVLQPRYVGPGVKISNNSLKMKPLATPQHYGAGTSPYPDSVQIIVVDLSYVG